MFGRMGFSGRLVRVLSVSAGMGLALLSVGVQSAQNEETLRVEAAWVRAMPAGLPAGGYFRLHNGGATAVSLTGAESPAYGHVMLHQTTHQSGQSQMAKVEAVEVPAGAMVEFAPGGHHLMLMSPKVPVKLGERVQVRLLFEGHRPVDVSFAVHGPQGKMPEDHAHH
ncbi:MAG: copper chaperone PCu(A)C [Pseudomonadota bacterium]|nr:copper chaperone PCu(A)C [Pseudomonadota bacterium]